MVASETQPGPLWDAIEGLERSDSRSGLQVIEPAVCMELLADTTTVGRIGFCDVHGQQLVPVNFVCHDGRIYFRTSPHSFLSRLGLGCGDVAFEVDHIDLLTQTGWSVLVKGSTEEVFAEPQTGPDWLRPWAGGDRSVVIEVTPRSITGRRVRKPGAEPTRLRGFFPPGAGR